MRLRNARTWAATATAHGRHPPTERPSPRGTNVARRMGTVRSMTRLGKVRRRCTQLVMELELPASLDPGQLSVHLGERIGSPIHLVAVDLPAEGAGGLWLETAAANYVFYDSATTGPHQVQIILHELGHICFEHGGTALRAPHGIGPHLDSAIIERIMRRTCYGLDVEFEAEMFASVLQERISRWIPDARLNVPPEAEELVARFSRTLDCRT